MLPKKVSDVKSQSIAEHATEISKETQQKSPKKSLMYLVNKLSMQIQKDNLASFSLSPQHSSSAFLMSNPFSNLKYLIKAGDKPAAPPQEPNS